MVTNQWFAWNTWSPRPRCNLFRSKYRTQAIESRFARVKIEIARILNAIYDVELSMHYMIPAYTCSIWRGIINFEVVCLWHFEPGCQ